MESAINKSDEKDFLKDIKMSTNHIVNLQTIVQVYLIYPRLFSDNIFNKEP